MLGHSSREYLYGPYEDIPAPGTLFWAIVPALLPLLLCRRVVHCRLNTAPLCSVPPLMRRIVPTLVLYCPLGSTVMPSIVSKNRQEDRRTGGQEDNAGIPFCPVVMKDQLSLESCWAGVLVCWSAVPRCAGLPLCSTLATMVW